MVMGEGPVDIVLSPGWVTYPERALALVLYGTFARLEPATGLLARIADTAEAALAFGLAGYASVELALEGSMRYWGRRCPTSNAYLQTGCPRSQAWEDATLVRVLEGGLVAAVLVGRRPARLGLVQAGRTVAAVP
jgi:hypothetical protein